jgi:hypothetical protein
MAALIQYQHTLEHFDYDCDYHHMLEDILWDNFCLGSLRDFPKLRHLCIQPEVLLASPASSVPPTLRLCGVIPPTIRHLGLYAGKSMLENRDVGDQICEFIMSTSKPASLVIEDVTHLTLDHLSKARAVRLIDQTKSCVKTSTLRSCLSGRGGTGLEHGNITRR